ncbi:transposon Tf2-1 poly [Paramuricea clavata]|uniref:Transposon Tf2-1 poly n=1 Tax=Paramuricea clavata TaxID=317549 RepID=A0A7D9HT80_PARCT|nr:transposon Tf2-1 poly [Paramuricea clavata]
MAFSAPFSAPQMDWETNDSILAFGKFKQKCELMFKSILKDAEGEEQVSYILLWVGEQGLDIYNSWTFEDVKDQKDPAKILDRFMEHLEPRTNHRIHRYTLQGMRQDQGESIDNFIAKIKNIAAKCKFNGNEEIEDRLFDQLIWGTNDPEGNPQRIDNITRKKLNADNKNHNNIIQCKNCGKTHKLPHKGNCPAHGTTCRNCGKLNHWQLVCKSPKSQHRSKSPYRKNKKSINSLEKQNETDPYADIPTIGTIEINSVENHNNITSEEIFTTLRVNRKNNGDINLKCKVDTGAQSNVLPIDLFRVLYPELINAEGMPREGALQRSDVILTAYGGSEINQFGKILIPCQHKRGKFNCNFYVTDAGPRKEEVKPSKTVRFADQAKIINQQQSQSRNYIKPSVPITSRPRIKDKEHLIEMYPECFDGSVGCFEDYTYHITLDPKVKPVVHAPRRVPLELVDKLNFELNEMEKNGVIEKVTKPTDWVNSIVIREKPNGRLRLCLDPKDLNEAIMRDHYPTPTLEEITPYKIDARNGYWNVKLDDESSYLTTFNTPNGRYRFLRMPFGLRMSQDVFQFKIDETYRNCPGATGIADDITVHGRDESNHDLHLHDAMERTRMAGIKLNQQKCIIKTSECSFFGMVYTSSGVKPDPEKVIAIQNMEPPKDKKELHTKAVVLQVDASSKGLGAVLLQENKPIAFAPKALIPAESRYANIERELLAVVYGCEKFHTYLYGRQFVVESDHRPLEQIQKKNLDMAPPRLQRMLLRLQPYDCIIKYKPGKEMVIADTLSRLSPKEGDEIPGMQVKIHHLVEFTPVELQQIKDETAKDGTLQILTEQVMQGWPDSIKKTQQAIKPYWNNRDDISIQEGVLLLGSRIIVPKSLRQKILQEIHSGHQGMEKCKLRAKSCVYWPGIYKEIENMVAPCCACKKFQNSQQKEPMISSEVPRRPWHTVSADLFKVNNFWYIVIADYYSKFPFVKKLNNLTATTVVNVVRSIFSEQGIPETLICDNGTQFTSAQFQDLAKRYGFRVVTSSPYYPKGHGFIERQVQTVKKILLKCEESGTDPSLALLSLRSIPLSATLKSPAELLNGRMFKTTLPVKIHPPNDWHETRDLLLTQQKKQINLYNRDSKEKPNLFQNQAVQVQDPLKKTWSPARVVGFGPTPRSYITEDESGVQIRRNRQLIKPDIQKTPGPTSPAAVKDNQSEKEVLRYLIDQKFEHAQVV